MHLKRHWVDPEYNDLLQIFAIKHRSHMTRTKCGVIVTSHFCFSHIVISSIKSASCRTSCSQHELRSKFPAHAEIPETLPTLPLHRGTSNQNPPCTTGLPHRVLNRQTTITYISFHPDHHLQYGSYYGY